MLDRCIGQRIAEACGPSPCQDQDGSLKALFVFLAPSEAGFHARPPGRWIFPSVTVGRASKTASRVASAARGRDVSNLRLVTLRFGERKPTAIELASHLAALSSSVGASCDYLSGRNLAQPILSAIHIRRDTTHPDAPTLLDPHLHGIWNIAETDIVRVRSYLAERFASVWIDDRPVRKLKAAAFYVTAGILDYRDVPSWSDDMVKALWVLPQMRMIRPAGWFADPRRIDSPKTADKARQRGMSRNARSLDQRHPKSDQRAANAVTERRGPSGRQRAKTRSFTSTVHVSASESLNLGKTPTLGEIWLVRRIIAQRLAGAPASSFENTCAAFGIPTDEGIEAVRVTESTFKASLFFPGDDWIPTDNARLFMERTHPLLVGFSDLYVDLRSDATAAEVRLSKKATDPP